eukprot:4655038-Amphidinium_carterae.2
MLVKAHAAANSVQLSGLEADSWPGKVIITVETDFAGDQVTRKSTTGVAIFLGSHCVRTQSNLQSTVSLSSGEVEYYGIVKARARGFLMKSLLSHFGIAVGTLVRRTVQEGVEVFSDSSAARAFAQRKGLGRQKHVYVRWLSVRARQGAFQGGYSGSRKHGCQRSRRLN